MTGIIGRQNVKRSMTRIITLEISRGLVRNNKEAHRTPSRQSSHAGAMMQGNTESYKCILLEGRYCSDDSPEVDTL
jgi:hypothetical protein